MSRLLTSDQNLLDRLLFIFLLLFAGLFIWNTTVQAQIFDPDYVAGWNVTKGIAFGDVDRDGDLDQFLGTIATQNRLRYISNSSNPGSRDPFPVETQGLGQGNSFFSIALGDLNGDGYLDIVAGGVKLDTTAGNSNFLYMYNGETGRFFRDPIWTSSTEYQTGSMALGDVDNDGDLDLVCGNGWNEYHPDWLQPNTLFLNQRDSISSIFAMQPDWQSGLVRMSPKVALGDLDGDGDLDLVTVDNHTIGAESQISIYLNRFAEGEISVYRSLPEPISLPGFNTAVALGDLDGDGDLDLVTNNIDGHGVALLNVFDESDPVIFAAEQPVWTVPDSLKSLQMGDLDGDGDLDLVAKTPPPDRFFKIYLNEGGDNIFSAQPVQEISTGETWWTLADVNGDGGLDLAGNQLYLNVGISFSPEPADSSIAEFATQGVAIGDINDDGWPDLVCGNDGTNELYPNFDGSFAPISIWNPQGMFGTRAIALGDVNNDGYLDLVCGNFARADVLYLHDGTPGTWFPAYPIWLSASTDFTTSVALGDVDGDGWLDLVCGIQNERNRLYRNLGGTGDIFPGFSENISSQTRTTRSVVLADMDSDGDLDLICGNDGQPNTIYLNSGRTFDTEFVWESADSNHTWSVAVGDIDGDTYLDLVCGNDVVGVTYYRNFGGSLTNPQGGNYQPWQPILSTISSVRSVVLKDVDADGDLDLLCGNLDGQNALYWNREGEFNDPPDWLSGPANATLSLAVGDLDRDGDFDLVSGNHEQVNTVYYGLRNPAFKYDPTTPTHHLVNTDAYLDSVTVQRSGDTEYRVSFKAVDPEYDAVWVRPQFQYEDKPTWRNPTIVGYPDGSSIGPLPSSPAGVTREFFWDVSQLDFDPRNVILRLRTSSYAGTAGVISRVPAYQKEIGPLDIRRAEVAATPDTIRFAGVTLGGSVLAVLSVMNIGNEPLEVNGVDLPSTEMWLLGLSTFTVQPGESHVDTLCLAPELELNVNGNLQIDSNAPRMPVFSIPVLAEIYPLAVRTDPLIEGDEAVLGEALTVQVIPAVHVNIERCALLYRAQDNDESFTAIEMVSRERSFTGVIPGQDVTEAGLEYYIEMQNGGVVATDPIGAPADSLFTIAVNAPALITTQPLPTSGVDFLEGREIAVQVSLDQGVVYEEGTLNYRRGGDSQYTSIPIPDIEPLPAATIPDSVVGPRGVEYWVQVQTSTSLLTDPPADPAGSPHTIRVRVADLVEPVTHAGFQYRMVSVPLDFGVDFNGTLESLLSDQAAFGPYPAERPELGPWRCFRGFPPEGDPLELPVGAPGDFRVQPGRGFWLISRAENWIATGPVAGTSTPTAGAFNITLEPGWNMIGHPFVFAVAWDSVSVDGQPPGAAAVEGPWFYDGTPYIEASLLEPFASYWIRNNSDSEQDLILSIPPQESTAGKAEVKDIDQRTSEDVLWQMTLTASCAGVQDGANWLGVIASASDTWDHHDRREPPPAPARSLSLYFLHASWPTRPGRYTVDFRPRPEAGTDGHSWRFDVAKDFVVEGAGDQVRLEFMNPANIPEDLKVLLVDRELLRSMDLREQATYSFYVGHAGFVTDEGSARFELLVGTTEFLAEHTDDLPDRPTRTALYQNRPNPFNPVTVIRYDVAVAGRVSLRIYDVTGALVKTVRDEYLSAQRYEDAWRGDDDAGRRVAAGVYFCRLQSSDGYLQTRKMTIIK